MRPSRLSRPAPCPTFHSRIRKRSDSKLGLLSREAITISSEAVLWAITGKAPPKLPESGSSEQMARWDRLISNQATEPASAKQLVEEPDSDLIRAAANGDREAFAELVRAYQTVVWRFLYRFLGDRALAEDVTQDTLIRVFLKLPSFSHRSKFSTWVLAVARNAGIDALRKRSRADQLTRSVIELKPDFSSPSPSAQVALDLAITALPKKLREAFLLIEFVGLRYEEAAEVLRIPIGTVKSRMHHARQSLVHELGAATDEA